MSDTLQYTRASKIRRFGPLAATSGNRSLGREGGSPTELKDISTPRSPLLPNDIQRSLLHVGMRIRKSVSEGYKRGPDAFEQALQVHIYGMQTITEPMKVAYKDPSGSSPSSTTAHVHMDIFQAKKRSLEDREATPPAWPSDRTIQTVLSFGAGTHYNDRSKIRPFAVPKTRKAKASAEAMDVDTQMFVDENGDFKDADFLEF